MTFEKIKSSEPSQNNSPSPLPKNSNWLGRTITIVIAASAIVIVAGRILSNMHVVYAGAFFLGLSLLGKCISCCRKNEDTKITNKNYSDEWNEDLEISGINPIDESPFDKSVNFDDLENFDTSITIIKIEDSNKKTEIQDSNTNTNTRKMSNLSDLNNDSFSLEHKKNSNNNTKNNIMIENTDKHAETPLPSISDKENPEMNSNENTKNNIVIENSNKHVTTPFPLTIDGKPPINDVNENEGADSTKEQINFYENYFDSPPGKN